MDAITITVNVEMFPIETVPKEEGSFVLLSDGVNFSKATWHHHAGSSLEAGWFTDYIEGDTYYMNELSWFEPKFWCNLPNVRIKYLKVN